MQPWFFAPSEMPFLEIARDQTSFWKTEFREMKLKIEPKPRAQTQNGRVTRKIIYTNYLTAS